MPVYTWMVGFVRQVLAGGNAGRSGSRGPGTSERLGHRAGWG
jgi:hypothetical protein